MAPSPERGAPAASVHDAVLTVIPLSYVVAVLAAFASPHTIAVALALGSIPATGSLGYALFYNPPRHG